MTSVGKLAAAAVTGRRSDGLLGWAPPRARARLARNTRSDGAAIRSDDCPQVSRNGGARVPCTAQLTAAPYGPGATADGGEAIAPRPGSQRGHGSHASGPGRLAAPLLRSVASRLAMRGS